MNIRKCKSSLREIIRTTDESPQALTRNCNLVDVAAVQKNEQDLVDIRALAAEVLAELKDIIPNSSGEQPEA